MLDKLISKLRTSVGKLQILKFLIVRILTLIFLHPVLSNFIMLIFQDYKYKNKAKTH